MRNLWFLVFLVLASCAAPVEGDESDDMRFHQYQWGQTKTIHPQDWQQNKPLTVVTKDPEFVDGHTSETRPFTKNLTLAATIPPTMGGNFALRWLVNFGVGGGAASFYIDANSLQQFAISADMVRVSIVSQYVGVVDAKGQPLGVDFGYTNPDGGDVVANAFFAEGMTATDQATLTQKFQVAVADNSIVIPIPAFTSTFRILGLNPVDEHSSPNPGTPFLATTNYSLEDLLGNVIDSYAGDEIYGFRLAPIPTGEAQFLRIVGTDGANNVSGSVEWGLDL